MKRLIDAVRFPALQGLSDEVLARQAVPGEGLAKGGTVPGHHECEPPKVPLTLV